MADAGGSHAGAEGHTHTLLAASCSRTANMCLRSCTVQCNKRAHLARDGGDGVRPVCGIRRVQLVGVVCDAIVLLLLVNGHHAAGGCGGVQGLILSMKRHESDEHAPAPSILTCTRGAAQRNITPAAPSGKGPAASQPAAPSPLPPEWGGGCSQQHHHPCRPKRGGGWRQQHHHPCRPSGEGAAASSTITPAAPSG